MVKTSIPLQKWRCFIWEMVFDESAETWWRASWFDFPVEQKDWCSLLPPQTCEFVHSGFSCFTSVVVRFAFENLTLLQSTNHRCGLTRSPKTIGFAGWRELWQRSSSDQSAFRLTTQIYRAENFIIQLRSFKEKIFMTDFSFSNSAWTKLFSLEEKFFNGKRIFERESLRSAFDVRRVSVSLNRTTNFCSKIERRPTDESRSKPFHSEKRTKSKHRVKKLFSVVPRSSLSPHWKNFFVFNRFVTSLWTFIGFLLLIVIWVKTNHSSFFLPSTKSGKVLCCLHLLPRLFSFRSSSIWNSEIQKEKRIIEERTKLDEDRLGWNSFWPLQTAVAES